MIHHALDILEYPAMVSRIADRARSSAGRQEIAAWHPLGAVSAIQRRLRETVEMRRLTGGGAFPFDRVGGVLEPLGRAQRGGQLRVAKLYDILMALHVADDLRQALVRQRDKYPTLAEHLAHLPGDLGDLAALLGGAVAERDRLRDDASAELARLRRQRDRALQQIRRKLDSLLQSPAFKRYIQEPVPYVREGRHVLAILAQYEDQVPGTVRGTSTSGASVFIEPEAITPLENGLHLAEDAEAAEVDRILWELSAEVAAKGEALATVAREWNLAVPEIAEAERAALRDELAALRQRIVESLPHLGETRAPAHRAEEQEPRIRARPRDRGERKPLAVAPGDKVYVRSLGRTMEVASVDEKRGKAMVIRGMIRTEVPLDDLQAGPLG